MKPLYKAHPQHPNVKIPMVRVAGSGQLYPAIPAQKLRTGDKLVADYGKLYRLQKITPSSPARINLHMTPVSEVHPTQLPKQHIVSPTTHVAVSWGTFNLRWPSISKQQIKPQEMKPMAQPRKVNFAKSIDLKSPINSGVSFHGKVDLTKQGGAQGKRINLKGKVNLK